MKATLDPTQVQLIVNVAHDLVSQTAPEELPLFRATSTAYFRDPEKALRERAGAEDMLGFGAELATALAPVAIALTSEVVQFLVEEVKKSLKEQSSGVVSDLVKKLFKKFRPAGQSTPEAGPTLTPRQLSEVRRRTYEKALQLKVPEAKAEQLADSMVASLAVSPA